MQAIQETVAKALLEIGAVGFSPHEPVTFKSGIVSPVYVDNRRLTYFPLQWERVIRGLYELVLKESLMFDIIAGIELGGVPHSAVFGYTMQRPVVIVRKAAKDHGKKRLIEGGSVSGEQVLLIEDLVTTGGSSLHGVEALRAEGAKVEHCVALISYGFADALASFAQAGVTLHTLTTFRAVLLEAARSGQLLRGEVSIVEDWLSDPHGWAARQGHTR